MIDLGPLYELVGRLFPMEAFELRFMRQALVGLILIAPMSAAMGVQVVNFRMAFFSDAISHSAFAGVAIGLLAGIAPTWTMPALAILIGLGIVAVRRRTTLATDTVIGVFFAGVVAFGLAVVSRDPRVSRDMTQFLYGDILTIGDVEILQLAGLAATLLAFQVLSYNRLLYIGLSAPLAKAHRVHVAVYEYTYAALLSLIVILSVRAVGVFLVTALLVVPAATARNLARSAGAMFWWSTAIAAVAAVCGLYLSAQDWANTATGATVVLVACAFFLASLPVAIFRARRPG